jgi:hypothetical protein
MMLKLKIVIDNLGGMIRSRTSPLGMKSSTLVMTDLPLMGEVERQKVELREAHWTNDKIAGSKTRGRNWFCDENFRSERTFPVGNRFDLG